MSRCILKALGNPGLNGIMAGLLFIEVSSNTTNKCFLVVQATSKRFDETKTHNLAVI